MAPAESTSKPIRNQNETKSKPKPAEKPPPGVLREPDKSPTSGLFIQGPNLYKLPRSTIPPGRGEGHPAGPETPKLLEHSTITKGNDWNSGTAVRPTYVLSQETTQLHLKNNIKIKNRFPPDPSLKRPKTPDLPRNMTARTPPGPPGGGETRTKYKASVNTAG